MTTRRFKLWLKLLLLGWLCLFTFTREWPPFGDEYYRIIQMVGQRQFDFLSWEVDAIVDKAEGVLANNDTFLDETSRKQIVLDYLSLIQQSQQIEYQINQIYTDPAVVNPETATAVLQTQLTQLRNEINTRQPVAEAIVQDQVSQILVDEKFGAEIVTKKGKVFKFDDTNCMINYMTKNVVDERDLAFRLITDYTQPGKLIQADMAFYVKDNDIHAPMNSQVAAFEDYEVMTTYKKKWKGIYLSWGELVTQFK